MKPALNVRIRWMTCSLRPSASKSTIAGSTTSKASTLVSSFSSLALVARKGTKRRLTSSTTASSLQIATFM